HARSRAEPLRHHARARDEDHGGDLAGSEPMRTHSSVISPRGSRARLQDLGEQGPAISRQRVSRVRLARRVTRRARWVVARAAPLGAGLAALAGTALVAGWLLTSPRFAV